MTNFNLPNLASRLLSLGFGNYNPTMKNYRLVRAEIRSTSTNRTKRAEFIIEGLTILQSSVANSAAGVAYANGVRTAQTITAATLLEDIVTGICSAQDVLNEQAYFKANKSDLFENF